MRSVPSKFKQIPKTSLFVNLHPFPGSAAWAEPPYGHGKRRDGLEIASSEPLNTRLEGRQGNASHRRHRRLEGPWKSHVEHGGAWFQNTGSPAGFKPKGKRRDDLKIASSELLNTRLQGRQGNTSHRRHRRLEGPWKDLVEHGGAWFRNTGSPAGFKPKAVPRQAKRWSRNSIIGTATKLQGRQGNTSHRRHRRLEGPWKGLVEHGGAWFRNTGSPAGFKPKAVPRQAVSLVSK